MDYLDNIHKTQSLLPTRRIQIMVNIDMFERVSGVLALLSPIKHQRHQVSVTTYDFTGVHTAHTLEEKDRNQCRKNICEHNFVRRRTVWISS